MSRGRLTRRHVHRRRPAAQPRAQEPEAQLAEEIAVEAIVVEEAASPWREDPVRALFDAIYRLAGEHVVGPLGDLARRFYNVSK